MEFVAVFTSPERVLRNDLLSAVGATQVKDLVIVENDLYVTTNFVKLSLVGWS